MQKIGGGGEFFFRDADYPLLEIVNQLFFVGFYGVIFVILFDFVEFVVGQKQHCYIGIQYLFHFLFESGLNIVFNYARAMLICRYAHYTALGDYSDPLQFLRNRPRCRMNVLPDVISAV